MPTSDAVVILILICIRLGASTIREFRATKVHSQGVCQRVSIVGSFALALASEECFSPFLTGSRPQNYRDHCRLGD